MKPARTSWVALLLLAGCSRANDSAPLAQRTSLSEGSVAVVGSESVSAVSVRRIASAQRVSLERARDFAVQDSLFAQASAERLSPAEAQVVRRGELARALYEQLERAARAKGAPTDAELQALTRERWLEFDRPPAARTSHAVVLLEKGTDKQAARRLAEEILAAVHGAKNEADFIAKAKAVPSDGLSVRAEELPAMTADGRPVTPDNPAPPDMRFDADFSEAANAIAEVGALSPIIETRFGFHVIFLAEKTPALHVPLEERRQRLAADVIVRRIHAAEKRLLEGAEAKSPVEVSRAAESLTAAVRVRR